MRESLSDPFVELEVDGVTAETDDGSLAGYALAYRVVDGAKPRVFLFGATSPRHWGEGVGRALLAWSSDRAREILEPHPLGTIQAQCGDEDLRTRRLYEAANGRPIRWFEDLELRFSARVAPTGAVAGRLPDGYAALPLAGTERELVRQLHNTCFADHWGSSEMAPETWDHFLEEESKRLDQSEVVVAEDGTLVGYLIAAAFPQDLGTTGHVLWVDKLGVRPGHRSKGIATALIERHLEGAAAAGYEGSMLGVDTASLTGANLLYGRIGYRRRHGAVRYIFGDAEFS